MPRIFAASWFLAAGLGLTGLGCTQQYTGGLGLLNTKQRDSVEAYRQEVAQREAQLQREAGEAAGDSAAQGRYSSIANPASPAHPGGHPGSRASAANPAVRNVAFTSQNMDSSAGRPETASRGQRRASVMGLYGQLSARPDARVSPMDGPGNVRRVSFTHEGADFDPEVDPTGKFVVYASTRHRTQSDIYIKAIDGNAITQLTSDPAADMMPTFSPDGRQIAFASERSGNWDIYVMEARGGQAVQITDSPAHEIHPSFSPDGTQLVYSTLSQASGQWELVVVDLANTATKKYIGSGLLPNWSPVDNRIVFQRARQRGTRWFSIWTLTYENGEAHSPTELAASDNAACITPDWSPDGKHVVFCTVINPQYDDGRSPTYADLWVMEEDGSNRSRLTHGQFTNLQPDWSRGGSIFFVSDRGGEGLENVFALRADQAIRVADAAGEPNQRPDNTATAGVPTE
jgi:TolB protein